MEERAGLHECHATIEMRIIRKALNEVDPTDKDRNEGSDVASLLYELTTLRKENEAMQKVVEDLKRVIKSALVDEDCGASGVGYRKLAKLLEKQALKDKPTGGDDAN